MDIFGENPTTGVTVDNDVSEDNQDYVARIVSEKGEQWKDPAVLAKGYYHAQKLIEDLKKAQEDNKANDYAKQLLDQIRNQQAQAPVSPAGGVVNNGSETENTTPSADDIERLVAEHITRRESENSKAANVAETNRLMSERFGTNASSHMVNRASQLGMSVESLKEMAGNSPKAFMALMGDGSTKQTNNVIASRVNTAGFTDTNGVRNSAYYSKMRKENRKQFYSGAVQEQMLRDRIALGDKF